MFVWPTRYRYLEMTFRGNVLPVRVDRFSGRTEVLYPQGWEVAQTVEEESRPAQALPSTELSNIRIIRMRYVRGRVEGELFNGTGYLLKEVGIRASARANRVLLFSRSFKANVDLAPGSSAAVNSYLDGLLDLDAVPLFAIESASGHRVETSAVFLGSDEIISIGTDDSVAKEGGRPTVVDLGRAIKTEYPGRYDHLSDWELGTAAKQQYPEHFGDFLETESGRQR
jgi:hypothetical protein